MLSSLPLLALGVAVCATPLVSAAALEKRLEMLDGFYNASEGGGSWTTLAANSGGLGEPLNVVISANSDPFIMTDEGLTDWMWSIQYSEEFIGQSLGDRQAANLGDGLGQRNQTDLLRYNYFDIYYGTLKESINGGSHIRYWRQNGSLANSGAWFVAASEEEPASQNHMIKPNGYDSGRDVFTGNATLPEGTKSPITNRTFSATADYQPGFLAANSSEGINHGIPTDGRVAVITVKVTGEPVQVKSSGAPNSRFALSSTDGTKLILAGVFGSLALALLV